MSWTNNESSTLAGSGGLIAGAQGAALASATTITPTDAYHVVTGVATVQTIDGSLLVTNTLLILQSRDGFSLGNLGNIVKGGTTAAGDCIAIFWDGTNATVVGVGDVSGMTTDTAQTVTGIKDFNVVQRFNSGLEGTTGTFSGALTALSINGTALPAMVGATSGANGVKGAVPAPLMGQQLFFLRGDGTWQSRFPTSRTIEAMEHVSAVETLGHLLGLIYVERDATISSVALSLSRIPTEWSGGGVTIDVRYFAPGVAVGADGAGGTSIYSVLANRPRIAWNAVNKFTVGTGHSTTAVAAHSWLGVYLEEKTTATTPERPVGIGVAVTLA